MYVHVCMYVCTIQPALEEEEDDFDGNLYDEEDDYNGGFLVRVKQKINQDRGCVAYPYNGSTQQALFMVVDGHGSEGDLVSEFVMRQIVVSLEKVGYVRLG